MTVLNELPHDPHKKLTSLWVWLSLIAVFICGILIQSYSFLAHDVSWLLHATERFLAGGNYSSDFYEINPPMVLYIHILPVLMAHFLKISLVNAVRIYVFTIAALSFLLCAHLLKKIIRPEDKALYFITLFTLVVVYAISPAQNFGQREHIATMLIMPYLFNAVIYLQGSRINNSILIGLMAGTGFVIKPHLLVTFFLIECYFILRTRQFSLRLRKEIIAIAAVFTGYLAAIFLFNSDYFSLIPQIYFFFSVFFTSSSAISELFYNDRVFFIVETAILYYALRANSSYPHLTAIFMLSVIGFFIYYLAEPIAVDYHTIPMFSLALLLTVFLFSELMLPLKIKFKNGAFLLATASLIFYLPFCLIYFTNVRFLAIEKNGFIPNQLIRYLKTPVNHKPFYIFSTNCRLAYPLVDYAGVESVSRYECMWPVFYITKLMQLHTPEARAELEKQRIMFTHAVVEDMKKNMPETVFINPINNWAVFNGVSFDYLQFFSQSSEFREIWKHYKYSSNIDGIAIYKKNHLSSHAAT